MPVDAQIENDRSEPTGERCSARRVERQKPPKLIFVQFLADVEKTLIAALLLVLELSDRS